MARKDYMKLALVIALTMAAATAYAGATTITSSLMLGGGSYSPSNKVTITADSTATSYAAKSQHQAGDRVVATNNQDPKMWYKTVAVGTAVEAAATSDVLDTSSWTSM
ncbi:MAG: hypothetical protein RW306_07445 [Geobacteraceae bacterium]|nr:hypothetical protein [Geobacteraceae bacterium]